MRLHIGIFGTIKLTEPFNGQVLHPINHFATAVITVTGVAFGIFVGETGAHGFHHLVADEILGRNELNAPKLALLFMFNELKKIQIPFHNVGYY
jgi:hypothetical protein